MFLERQAELLEESVALLVGACGGHKGNLKTVDSGVLVDVNLGENDLLLESESVVAASIHILGDTVEVTDTGKSNPDELLEELIHLDVAQGNLCSDGHSLTELEIGNILAGSGDDSLLACDEGKLGCGFLDNFLVLGAGTDTFIDADLYKAGNLHDSGVAELLHQLVNNLFLICLLEGRNISFRQSLNLNLCVFLCHNYLISSPDFLAIRTFLSPSMR